MAAPEQPSRIRTAAWLALPTIVLVLAAVVASRYRLPTRIAVELVTKRVSFVVGESSGVDLLGSTRGFLRLVVEGCQATSFDALAFGPADGEEAPAPPAYQGDVGMACNDADAKTTVEGLNLPGAVGSLDRVRLAKGDAVALQVAGDSIPVITVSLDKSRRLDLPIYRDLLLTTEFVDVHPSLGLGGLATYRVQLNPSDSWLHLQTDDQTVLVITPIPESTENFFDERLRLPIEAAQFFEETAEGLASALVADGVVTYPGYPQVPPVTIGGDDFLVLRQATDLEIRRLRLSKDPPGLAITVEGDVREAAIGRPQAGAATEERTGQWLDPRLTAYQIVQYGPLWTMIATLAAWGLATTWTWYERWKKLSE